MMTLCAEKKIQKKASRNQTPTIRFRRNLAITPESRLWRKHHFPAGKIPAENGFPAETVFLSEKAVSGGKNSVGKMTKKKQTAPY